MGASSSWRMVSRLSNRVQQTISITTKPPFDASSILKSAVNNTRRFSPISRLPVELSGMLPLHTAIASARLTSCLSLDSQSWCFVPQGISMPL